MTAHIHKACIVALAEDTRRRLEYWSEDQDRWKEAAKNGDPIWFKHARFRVLDLDWQVIAETPERPTPPRVRIPETTLPAPLESAEGYEQVWTVSTFDMNVQFVCQPGAGVTCWATREEAQEWLDFLTAPREAVEDE